MIATELIGKGHGIWALILAALRCLVLIAGLSSASAGGFAPEKTGFSLRIRGNTSSYRVMSAFALPADSITLEFVNPADHRPIQVESAAGQPRMITPAKWFWRAPGEPGVYPIHIWREVPGDTMVLNVFVAVPYSRLQGEYLNGYRIGKYPGVLFRDLAVYAPPKGFVEVTAENEDTRLSPHFALKQFVCKQSNGYPKYVVLRQKLLLKLEMVLEKTNEHGYACQTFNILSGYRTPYYNHSIGNVKYSRHQWGGAADFFVDEDPPDGLMDDLNADGRIDWRDAAVLYKIVDDLYGKKEYDPYEGGLGQYKKTPAHGPFVHLDVRGWRARWGD